MKKGTKVKLSWDSTQGTYTIDFFKVYGWNQRFKTAEQAAKDTNTSIDQVVVFFSDRTEAALYYQCRLAK